MSSKVSRASNRVFSDGKRLRIGDAVCAKHRGARLEDGRRSHRVSVIVRLLYALRSGIGSLAPVQIELSRVSNGLLLVN